MASPRKPAKQGSAWGGFLSQAVASVESRLDTILGDEDEKSSKGAQPSVSGRAGASPRTTAGSQNISRSNSGARTNDRLQERLDRAMAKKKADGRPESPLPVSQLGSGTVTPLEESRENHEPTAPAIGNTLDSQASTEGGARLVRPAKDVSKAEHSDQQPDTTEAIGEAANSRRASMEHDLPVSAQASTDGSVDIYVGTNSMQLIDGNGTTMNTSPLRLEIEHEALEKKLQEELHPYIEKIDALQAKLQYLSREAADSAKQAAIAAQSGSAEKKLLEKDERIALLMEEGEKLSKTEMNHLALIKNLRSQAASKTKEQNAIKFRADTTEKTLASMEQRALRAEKALQMAFKDDGELETIRKERDALSATLAEMKADLGRANVRAEGVEIKAQNEETARLKRQLEDLRDDMTSARIERELAEEKLRREISDLTASVAREKERYNAMETEMLGEQAALEGKLESFRSRAEEASSVNHGDSQAKMLRQIEHLQNQYSVASENWQGIEGSLQSRIAGIENDRDEATKREADLRRKARDAALKAKKTHQEIERNHDRIQELEQALAEGQAETQKSVRNAQQAEEQVSKLQTTLEDQQTRFEKQMSSRIEEEKARWSTSLSASRTESPVASVRKSSTLDIGHLTSSSHNRRPSAMPFPSSTDSYTPPRQDSRAGYRASTNGLNPQTPSIHSIEHDDYFPYGLQSPNSPAQTHRGLNDLVSNSTVGAGPSVQLVERMSASVRRLESEKAASKDELARLTSQRDEARQEVVNLMREVEQKRTNDERIKTLEEELRAMDARYQATLEMLGEKTERVEELKADVADVKQMFRELVDGTMK